MEYYPNACIVCNGTEDLKRCSRCQMVSYCCVPHQKKHWPDHKKLCGVIFGMMKEQGVSHLYENLRGCNIHSWRKGRLLLLTAAEKRYNKAFKINEEYLFKFPRSCFVCYESRQNLLQNCPGCPSASFCKQHPSSLIHDEDCAKIRKAFHTYVKFDEYPLVVTQVAVASLLLFTKPFKPSEPLTSMKEFIFEYANRDRAFSRVPVEVKLFLTDMFSIVLTLYGALQKLEFQPNSELTVHLQGPIECGPLWELLLHLYPKLKVLKILIADMFSPKDDEYKDSDLCPKCSRQDKNLIIEFIDFDEYLKGNCEKPDFLICTDRSVMSDDDYAEKVTINLLNLWSRLKCPVIMTTLTMGNHNSIKKTIKSSLGITEFFFEGHNVFKSLVCTRNFEDGRIGLPNEHMIILKPGNHSEKKPTSELTPRTKKREVATKRQEIFYASICHVCGSPDALVPCNRCKMIFYCGKSHQDEHQAQHKELCKTILALLNESGAPNLFDKLKTKDSNLWLKAKLYLMSKARTKLGREFLEFEKQMFLCPKTCFVCHESDLSILKNCKCGVTFCKIHKDNLVHKDHCDNLSLAFKLSINKRPEVPKTSVKKLDCEKHRNVPMAMKAFIDSYLSFEKKICNFDIPDLEKLLISDFLTRPLTLLWSLEKINYKKKTSLIVHVIGSTNSEVSAQKYWKLVLYRIRELKSLKIIFIGSEISNPPLENELEFPTSSLAGKNLEVETHSMRYEEYFQSDSFIKPNIIMGFNLHFHESDLGIVNYSWKETIQTLPKINVPFILTAGSENRAERDHETICRLLGKCANFIYSDKNPFAGLIPERDFETEKVLFSNQYLIVYDEMC